MRFVADLLPVILQLSLKVIRVFNRNWNRNFVRGETLVHFSSAQFRHSLNEIHVVILKTGFLYFAQ